MSNAVIYARYSSAGQNEQTIEGQLRACHECATRLGYTVIEEYIDRAKSGTNDKRPRFQQMISDATKKQFQLVIVYMTDRFSRNKYDSVIYKHELRQYGVKVTSAMEQISDTEEGFLVEGLLEMFAEQYSRKLSVRIKNAFQDSLRRGTAWGGAKILGYRIENNKYVIDEETAPIVQYLFERYAAGDSVKKIVDAVNSKGYKTARKIKFAPQSFQTVLRNTKYIGKYSVNGVDYENRFPAIIDETLFETVQKRIEKNRKAPATQKAKVEYLLYGKLKCGHCGAHAYGVSGTSRTGQKHSYYACSARYKNKTCDKKHELKEEFEIWLVSNIKKYILTKTNAVKIVNLLLKEYKRNINQGRIDELKNRLSAIDKELNGIVELMLKAKNPQIIENLDKKADEFSLQKKDIETELSKIMLALALPHSPEDLLEYLLMFAAGDPQDIEYRRKIIDRLINSVFVYDDKVLCYFNVLDNTQVTFEMLPDLERCEIEIAPEKGYSEADSNVRISNVLVGNNYPNTNQAYFVIAGGRVGLLVYR